MPAKLWRPFDISGQFLKKTIITLQALRFELNWIFSTFHKTAWVASEQTGRQHARAAVCPVIIPNFAETGCIGQCFSCHSGLRSHAGLLQQEEGSWFNSTQYWRTYLQINTEAKGSGTFPVMLRTLCTPHLREEASTHLHKPRPVDFCIDYQCKSPEMRTGAGFQMRARLGCWLEWVTMGRVTAVTSSH